MKTVIITGASRGIGAATALYFAERGWNVVINYCSSEKRANEVVDAIRDSRKNVMAQSAASFRSFGTAKGSFGTPKLGEAVVFRADVAEKADCEALVRFAAEKFGRIDALVNNAAVSEIDCFDLLPPDREKRLFDVNLFAPMTLSKLVLPYMLHNGKGSIVNVSSMWGQVGASCEVQYSTAKAGIIGFTKALAKELAPSDIRVNCVAPGVIDTEMNVHLSPDDLRELTDEIPMCRLGTAREVAECIYFLCDSASYVTGQVLAPNGGYVT